MIPTDLLSRIPANCIPRDRHKREALEGALKLIFLDGYIAADRAHLETTPQMWDRRERDNAGFNEQDNDFHDQVNRK